MTKTPQLVIQSVAFPLAAFQLADASLADVLLTRWGHYLGPCNRPFGRQDWVLALESEPLAIATSASAVSATVQRYLEQHQQDRIFRGRARPHQLTGATRLAGVWFKAFKSLGLIPELASFEVHGMLFRTWDHLEIYHLYGLETLRRQMFGGSA